MNNRELVQRGWCKEGWTERDRRWKGGEEMNGDGDRKWQSDKEGGGTLDLIIHLRLLLIVLKRELMTCESTNIVFVCSIYWFFPLPLWEIMSSWTRASWGLFFFGVPLWKFPNCQECLRLCLFNLTVFPKGMVSICPLCYSELDIDHRVL